MENVAGTKQPIYLKDYQPPVFLIEHTELDINLTPELAMVTCKLLIIKNPASSGASNNLVLDGTKLMLKAIAIDEKELKPIEYKLTDQNLTLFNVPDRCEVTTVVTFKPQENTELSGLYKSNKMYCTQCEAEGFRRITYYIDRPDVMSKFLVTIHADKQHYPVLLSNGNLVAQGAESSTKHFATWEDPYKKPCYLFAMVAGDLVSVSDNFLTKSGRLVKLQLYVERSNLDQTAHALAALKKAMAWDEENYGREYDLDIYMIVAVNDFNMGAMENKGLNIFNSKYILVSPATASDRDYAAVDMVIGHEYFHNWSGNRVTCRDWFQLSLKEGFTVFREQQYTQDITQSSVVRIDDVNNLLNRQFPEDAGPLAHSVRPDSYLEINNFYTMTVYEKGAEVIRMLRTLLGEKKFRAGTDLYFSRFDGQAVTTDDFVAVMQEASGIDLTQFKLWYMQAGTPEISLLEAYDEADKTYTLTLTQFIPDTPAQTNKLPMHIPVVIGLLDANGNDMPLENPVLALTKAEQTFVFKNIPVLPKLSILRNFSAPVKLKHTFTDAQLAFLLEKDSDNFNRWFAGQQLYTHTLLQLIQDLQQNKPLSMPSLLRESFLAILLDDAINLDLKAALLTLPSMQLLIETVQPFANPDLIYKAKQFVFTTLAQELHTELTQMYAKYTRFEPYRYTAIDAALRNCRNVIFAYLVSTKSAAAITLAQEQFDKANNMTDTIAALAGIANIDCNQRIECLLEFYNTWAHNPLVVDKWLAIQALADFDTTLDHVQLLTKHEAFDIKNPNKVYALICTFSAGNPYRFHVATGAGYKFIADMVLQLNQINPQMASRVLRPLTNWQRFDQQRQQLMCGELLRIKQHGSLSNDVVELVSKSLEVTSN